MLPSTISPASRPLSRAIMLSSPPPPSSSKTAFACCVVPPTKLATSFLSSTASSWGPSPSPSTLRSFHSSSATALSAAFDGTDCLSTKHQRSNDNVNVNVNGSANIKSANNSNRNVGVGVGVGSTSVGESIVGSDRYFTSDSSLSRSTPSTNRAKLAFSTLPSPSPYTPSSSHSSSSTTVPTKHLSSVSDSNNVHTDNNELQLIGSSRGRKAVSLLPVYLTDARSVTQYHPVSAPDGALQLSVAENQMLEDLLIPALTRFALSDTAKDTNTIAEGNTTATGRGAIQALFKPDQIYYQPTHGRPQLRDAVALYLQRLLRIPAHHNLDRDGLVCGAGCNAVLENLCFCLAESGDAVLLPTPYYAAFEFDLVARAGLNIVPVNTMAHNTNTDTGDGSSIPKSAYYPNRASLDESYDKAKAAGSEPKILLLSHPNNPLGISYPKSVITECIQWAIEKKVHIVSDEIYAGSVYRHTDADTGEDTFHSALTLAAAHANAADPEGNGTQEKGKTGIGLSPYVHFVYALSKDFALSGLRVGVSYSENKDIRMPLQKLNDMCQISSQTQSMVEGMLSTAAEAGDDDRAAAAGERLWSTDTFLPQNQERIRRRCDRLQECLTEMGIPHLDANSGMFVWMDMTEFLPQKTLMTTNAQQEIETDESKDQRERALYLELLQEFGLLFTPGRSMRNELPGFFRCVFTAASDDEFDLGLKRIRKFVVAKRK